MSGRDGRGDERAAVDTERAVDRLSSRRSMSMRDDVDERSMADGHERSDGRSKGGRGDEQGAGEGDGRSIPVDAERDATGAGGRSMGGQMIRRSMVSETSGQRWGDQADGQ
ncbi:Zinc finger transcription factor, putative [Babesia ovata]|uniref:Zinc finger transcription factor, putative n=1 Tax=Babesia ovata TaxID=189622 RepID=A0A2H6KJD2_9APIC|nr:Zinc finger transcription factor, putative [Babesia ovata]GBE63105.1 Zinc finger transcription factor, putative [Babesia ovata]